MAARRVVVAALAALLLGPLVPPAPAYAAEPETITIPDLLIEGQPVTVTLPPGLDAAALDQLGFDPSRLDGVGGMIVKWHGGKGTTAKRMALVRKALGDPGVKWMRRLAASRADLYRIPPFGDPAEFQAYLQQLVDAAAAFTTPPGADPATVTLEMRLAELRRKGIDWVEPDYRVSAFEQIIDPYVPQQWALMEPPGVNLLDDHRKATGKGVRVAVVDTGVLRHPDLAGRILPGYDFISDPLSAGDSEVAPSNSLYARSSRDSDATDPGDALLDANGKLITGLPETCYQRLFGGPESSWHGTHVAGIIGAIAGNGVGIAGIAPGAKILPVRVLGRCGGSESDVSDGIIWASGGSVGGAPRNPYPAQVINLSLGGWGPCSKTMQAAISGAIRRGASVVVAAGNDGRDARLYHPANCTGTIAVGAHGSDGKHADFSNDGEAVAIWAPGVRVISTYNAGLVRAGEMTYSKLGGTSMAAPHVAGAIALLMDASQRYLGPAEVRTRLGELPDDCAILHKLMCDSPKLDIDKLLYRFPYRSKLPPSPEPTGLVSPTPSRTPSPSASSTPSPGASSTPSPTPSASRTPAPSMTPSRPSGGSWLTPLGTLTALSGGSGLALAPRATRSYAVSWSPVSGASYFYLKGYYAINPKGTYAQGARVTDCPADLTKYANTEWTGQQRTGTNTSGDIGPLSAGSHCTIVRVRAFVEGLGTYTLGVSPVIFVGP